MFLSFWVFQRQTQLTASLEPFAVTSAFKLAGNLPKAYCLIQNICETVLLSFFFSNIMHGSDSVESANKEIALWFKEEELVSWAPAEKSWVYED